MEKRQPLQQNRTQEGGPGSSQQQECKNDKNNFKKDKLKKKMWYIICNGVLFSQEEG
jgi:hypothetical protein